MLGMVMACWAAAGTRWSCSRRWCAARCRCCPPRWAMQGMLDIVLRGQGLEGVLPEAGVLLGMAAVLFVIGVLRFKYE